MSGPKSAGYTLSADRLAQLHAQREAERQRALEEARRQAALRQWRTVELRHHALRRRASRLAARNATAAHVADLPAPGATSAQIEAAARAATAVIAQLDAQLAGQERAARDGAVRDGVADLLRGSAAATHRDPRRAPAVPAVPAVDDTRTDELARCVRLLGRLDPEAEPTAELTGLTEQLHADGTDSRARRLLLARVQHEVDALNNACAERRRDAEVRAEAEAVLTQTGDEALRAVLAGRADTAVLRAATAAATARDRSAREEAFVQDVVLDVLRAAGLTVTTGFAVHTPHAGVIVRHDRDPASHGVEVRVDGGTVGLQAVRLGGDGPRTSGDLQAEQELCAVAPEVWKALDRRGVRVGRVEALPVGLVVPRQAAPSAPAPTATADTTDAAPSRPRVAARKARQRERRIDR